MVMSKILHCSYSANSINKIPMQSVFVFVCLFFNSFLSVVLQQHCGKVLTILVCASTVAKPYGMHTWFNVCLVQNCSCQTNSVTNSDTCCNCYVQFYPCLAFFKLSISTQTDLNSCFYVKHFITLYETESQLKTIVAFDPVFLP